MRRVNDIRAHRSARKDGQWLTMSEVAAELGVNNHRIRRLIKDGILPAEQVLPRAPYQFRASDLLDPKVIDAVARTDRPCRAVGENQISIFQLLNEVRHYERVIALGRQNWLFARSLRAGKRAAAVMSPIPSAKLNGHDPYAYIHDVLTRLHTHPASRIEELLPHRWRQN